MDPSTPVQAARPPGGAGRALRAEGRKLATIRMTAGLLGLAVAYVLLNTVALLALQGVEDSPADAGTTEGLRLILGLGSSAYLFSFVIGILASAGEYRHGTITATLLADPDRTRVLAAKMAATGAAGAVYGAVCAALCLAVALPWLAVIDNAPLTAADLAYAGGGTVAGVALFGTIGAALGALVRSQVLAVVAGLLWIVLGEGILLSVLPEVGRWLPSGALTALTRTGADVLPAWGGALLLAGYALVLAVAAVVVDSRRDVL